MTVKSARIVYLVAESGAGKTFTGDYLEAIHGFKHVDGDTPLFSAHIPGYAKLVTNYFMAGLWQPYFDECARLTLNAARDNDRVVFTHATDLQEIRDYYLAKLAEGGVPVENISLVQLTIDRDVKYRDLYHRSKRQNEGADINFEDMCRTWGWEFEGEMTMEKWMDCMDKFDSIFKANEISFEDWEAAIKVDVSGRDISHFDGVDAALSLTRPYDWPYDKLCDVVKAVDVKRLEETRANGAWDALFSQEEESAPAMPSREDEVEVDSEAIKRRRLSVIELELINGIRQRSSSSVIGDERLKSLRSTLILTGKLDLDFVVEE